MAVAKWLTLIGGFLLLVGLIAAFLSSHYADRVMGELKSGQLVFGAEPGTGEWQEKKRLRDRADRLFYASVGVTGLGVVLQTLGSLLSLKR